MNINYNIDYNLLNVEPIKSLKGNSKLVTWLVMCMIIHFTRETGSCKVPKNQLSKDLGVSNKFLGRATSLLLSIDWIKEIKPYDRALQEPAIYTTSIGYSSLGLKLWSSRPKAIVPRTKEKEFQKNSKQGEYDRSNRSYPPLPGWMKSDDEPFDFDFDNLDNN